MDTSPDAMVERFTVHGSEVPVQSPLVKYIQCHSSIVSKRNDEITLKRHHNYYYQIWGQLAILNLEWCDFIIWTNVIFMWNK